MYEFIPCIFHIIPYSMVSQGVYSMGSQGANHLRADCICFVAIDDADGDSQSFTKYKN